MNKISLLSLLIAASISLPVVVEASHQTLTLGYSQSKVKDIDGLKKLNGGNLKYRYEWNNSRFSFMTSLSYLRLSDKNSSLLSTPYLNTDLKINYFSIGYGPAFRFNDYFSVYGLLGLVITEVETIENYTFMKFENNRRKGSLLYGAGIQVNIAKNFTIDAGYEGVKVKYIEKDYSVDGFNINIGYRF